jgi:hypothetical protein
MQIPMIFGVNLPNYSSLGNRDAMVAIAERAEALGYSSLWTSDHILVPKDRPEPFGNVLESFTTLSYLAACTEHIRLGTGILVLPQRNPLLAAKQAATIQHLTIYFGVSRCRCSSSVSSRQLRLNSSSSRHLFRAAARSCSIWICPSTWLRTLGKGPSGSMT